MKLTAMQAVDKSLKKWRGLAESGSDADPESCALCEYTTQFNKITCKMCPAYELWSYGKHKFLTCCGEDEDDDGLYWKWANASTSKSRRKWASEIVRVLELAKKEVGEMLIDYTIHGTIQLEGDNPQEALRGLTPMELESCGQDNKVEFSIDGEDLGVTWDLMCPAEKEQKESHPLDCLCQRCWYEAQQERSINEEPTPF